MDSSRDLAQPKMTDAKWIYHRPVYDLEKVLHFLKWDDLGKSFTIKTSSRDLEEVPPSGLSATSEEALQESRIGLGRSFRQDLLRVDGFGSSTLIVGILSWQRLMS